MEFTFLTILIAVGIFLYIHLRKTYNYWALRNVAGPEPTFIFGNIKDFILKKKSQGEVYKEICNKYPKEKVVGIFRMRTPVLLVKDADVARNILVKDSVSFGENILQFSERKLGLNLFHTTDDSWRVLRNLVSGLYTPLKVKNMTGLMVDRAEKLADFIEEAASVQPEQEIFGLFRKFTESDTSVYCAFVTDNKSYTVHHIMNDYLDKNIFTHNYSSMIEIMYPGMLNKIGDSLSLKAGSDYLLSLTKDMLNQINSHPNFNNVFMDLMKQLKKMKVSRSEKDIDDPKTSRIMTDEIITAQLVVFFAAGYKSSTLTVAHSLYHLAFNPEIQNKAVAEIEDTLQKSEGKITAQAVLDVKYLDQIIEETLRMHPPVDFLKRRALKEYDLPGTNLTVQKGQLIIIPLNSIHTDEKYYSNPEVFDPERFSAENKASIYPGAYFPFGLGPRQCVGYRLSEIRTKVVLMKLLSRFRIEPGENTPKQIKYDPNRLLLQPLGGLHLNFIKKP